MSNMDTLQLPLHIVCLRTKAVYGTKNYILVGHNSGDSKVNGVGLLQLKCSTDSKKIEVSYCAKFGTLICSTKFNISNSRNY